MEALLLLAHNHCSYTTFTQILQQHQNNIKARVAEMGFFVELFDKESVASMKTSKIDIMGQHENGKFAVVAISFMTLNKPQLKKNF